MSLVQARFPPIKFASSADLGEQGDKDLLTVVYKRVQKASPDFIVIYDGIDQSVDINISTFVFRVAPEPVVALYDFVMTTFANTNDGVSMEAGSLSMSDSRQQALAPQAPPNLDKIRVIVNLASVEGLFSLALSTMKLIQAHSDTRQ
jgi:vacuolar protein sorting-associated protein 13A/C